VAIVPPPINSVSLEETIRSVLLQGLSQTQLRRHGRGSTDGSLTIIEKYAPWLDNWATEPDRQARPSWP